VISQRPEVTRVSDTDGDGKADFYQVMSDEFGMSGNYHEFHFTPVKDKEETTFSLWAPALRETGFGRSLEESLIHAEGQVVCTHLLLFVVV
jgi:hypothetical protein